MAHGGAVPVAAVLLLAGVVQVWALRGPRARVVHSAVHVRRPFPAFIVTVLYMFVVLPGSLVTQLFGWDALGQGHWQARGPVRSRRATTRRATVGGAPVSGRRWVVAVGVGVVAVLLAGGVVARSRVSTEPRGFGAFVAAADAVSTAGVPDADEPLLAVFPDEPWGPGLLTPPPVVDDDELGWVLEDVDERYVTIRDGARASTQVADPTVEVWLFGGSAVFGLGQRDDGTIASALVRLAAERGRRIAVRNLGVPAYVNSQETQVFADLLARGPAPDVAVFFDGVNELGAAYERETFGLLDPDEDVIMAATTSIRSRRDAQAQARGHEATHDIDRQARLAARQYDRGVRAALRLAHDHGVEVLHVWQPWLGTIPVDRPGVGAVLDRWSIRPQDLAGAAQLTRLALQYSTVAPVDLTRLFDEVDHPVYWDWSHTSEVGAGDQAEALLEYLLPLLDRAGARPVA